MEILSKHLEKAIEQLQTLPGVGKRTALRFAMNLLKRNEFEIDEFVRTLISLKKNVKSCRECGNISDVEICSICTNINRNKKIICIVEDIKDVMAIESTAQFKGVYHVLGGVISPMDGIGPMDLNIPSLISKIENTSPQEIILALNATMEGDTTNFYLFKKIKNFSIKVTSLTRGVAIGSELHYTDEITLGSSLNNRQPFKNSIGSI